jgi:hypothetical protein
VLEVGRPDELSKEFVALLRRPLQDALKLHTGIER